MRFGVSLGGGGLQARIRRKQLCQSSSAQQPHLLRRIHYMRFTPEANSCMTFLSHIQKASGANLVSDPTVGSEIFDFRMLNQDGRF